MENTLYFTLLLVIAALSGAAVAMLIVILTKSASRKSNQKRQLDILFSQQRREIGDSLHNISTGLMDMSRDNADQKYEIIKEIRQQLDNINLSNEKSIRNLQDSNEKKLDEMRKTVDEKLDKTLTERFNSSFNTVSSQLERVYKSLGEMRDLSSGITDNVKTLNRTLTNVKSRGTWGEAQLKMILDDIIPTMYVENFATNDDSSMRVEFAVKIPSQTAKETVYLPIDSKFPMEDYIRLIEASENSDSSAMTQARKSLKMAVMEEAKKISKYINQPKTTPFAVLYLATDGLFAEIVQDEKLIEKIRRDHHIMITGPSTVSFLLSSLSMGYKTLAINQKTEDVWRILSVAKQQYKLFGDLLGKVRKKITEAGDTIDKVQDRGRIIQDKMDKVQSIDITLSNQILQIDENDIL